MILGFFKEYRWLSNFHLADISFDGKVWPSVEHYYQAQKTLDPAESEAIRLAKEPKDARRLGQKVKVREDWEEIKNSVMLKALKAKFTQNRELRDKLVATGRDELVEDNWWGDMYWGVCKGVGLNVLGVLLTEVREELSRGKWEIQL